MYLVENGRGCAPRSEVRDPAELAYVTQTTLSVDDTARHRRGLRARFPRSGAAQGRHLLRHPEPPGRGEELSRTASDLLVVGSRNSSNSNRLRELAEKEGTPPPDRRPEDIDPAVAGGQAAIGVTAGASAPEVLVQQVIARLRELGRDDGRGKRRPGRKRGVRAATGSAMQIERWGHMQLNCLRHRHWQQLLGARVDRVCG
jgi:4-hydroxy-3-methylbut-2-enyl diphosphate reductase